MLKSHANFTLHAPSPKDSLMLIKEVVISSDYPSRKLQSPRAPHQQLGHLVGICHHITRNMLYATSCAAGRQPLIGRELLPFRRLRPRKMAGAIPCLYWVVA